MSELTDRERILMTVVAQLCSTMVLAPGCKAFAPGAFKDANGYDYVHFGLTSGEREPKAGDLVLAKTGPVSPWKVAWYVEPLPGPYGGAVVREIGTGRLCNYGNEEFTPIIGMPPLELLEGEQRVFLSKVRKAFRRGDEYLYRFGGVDFDGDEAVIWVREAFGGLGATGDNEESVPFEVRMKWSRKTTIKAILEAMRAAGYGTREFDRSPKEVRAIGST